MSDFTTEYKDDLRKKMKEDARKRLSLAAPSAQPAQPAQGSTPQEAKVETQAVAESAPKSTPEDGKQGMAASAFQFLKEMPKQAVGGVFDAINHTVDTARDLGRAAGIPDFMLQVTNEAGEFDPKFLSPEETKAGGGMKSGWLPEVGEAETAAGGFTRAITQFATGFIPISKGLKAAGMTRNLARGIIAGGVADGVTADPHQTRLSSLLNEVPALQDVVPDYMADNDPANETAWEGRLKNVVEGLVIGGAADLAVDGTVKMLKAYKVMKAAKASASEMPKSADDMLKESVEKADAQAAANEEIIQEKVFDMGPEEVLNETPKGDFEINHMRIKDEKDIKNVIQNMADRKAAELKAGSKTWDETAEASTEEFKAVNDLLGRETSQPFTAAEAVASREILASSAKSLEGLAKLASGPMANADDMFRFRRAVATHQSIQEVVFAGRKATAQALNAWKIPAGSNKARTQAMADMMNYAGKDTRKLAEMVSDVSGAGGNVSATVGQAGMKKWADAHYQIWINGLLSNPATHAANMISNLGTTVMSIPERFVSAGFESMTGSNGSAFIEARARAFGFLGGLSDGMKLMTGKTQNSALEAGLKVESRTDAISAAQWGKTPDSTVGKGLDYLGKAIGLPSWALGKGDLFFKGLNARMMLQEKSAKMAFEEGLTGKEFNKRVADLVQNPSEPMMDVATDFARYQTFTNQTGDIAKSVGKLASSVPMGRYIVPFINTPANILSYGFERTPLAPFMSSYKSAIRQGGTAAATARAQMAAGTVLMGSMAPLALSGKITGAGPANPSERRALEETGWQPYSVKMGNTYVSYARLEPLSTLIGYSADATSIIGQINESEGGEVVAAGLASMARNLTSKTFLSGMAEFSDVVMSNSPAKWERYAQRMGTSLAVPFVSSAGRAVGNYFDPVMHDTTPNSVDGYLKTFMQKAMDTIPGMGKDQPVLRDVWGNERGYGDGIARPMNTLSPIKIKKADNDPVNKLIADSKIGLNLPARRIQGVKLSNKEYSEYTKLAGEMAKAKLDQLYQSGIFDRVSKGKGSEFEMIVDRVISRSRKAARAQMLMNNADLAGRLADEKVDKMNKLMGE